MPKDEQKWEPPYPADPVAEFTNQLHQHTKASGTEPPIRLNQITTQLKQNYITVLANTNKGTEQNAVVSGSKSEGVFRGPGV